MRKLLFGLAVLLIVAALAGPAVTGRLIERSVTGDDSALSQSLPGWLVPASHQYHRGWFRATSALRLVVTDRRRAGPLAGLLAPGRFGDEPALIVESVITHGPIVDLLTPALTRIDSALFTESREGERIALPLTATTTVGLTGNLNADWVLAEGGTLTAANGVPLTWLGARGSYEATPGGGAEAATLRVDSIDIGAGEQVQHFEDIEAGYAIRRDGADATLTATFSFDAAGAGMGPVTALSGSAGVSGLPLAAMRGAGPFLRDLATAGVGNVGLVMARHEALVRAALDDALPVRWQQVAGTEYGDIRADFDIVLPAAAAIGAGGADTLASGITAAATVTGRVELPVAFADAVRDADPGLHERLTMLRGTGMLVADAAGDTLVMDVDYSDGSLRVNGAPLPVALSGPSGSPDAP